MKLENVMAVSLDGKISHHDREADAERKQSGFTNSEDYNFVVARLECADAILVGAQTVRSNGAVWDIKNKSGRYPIWLVFSHRGLDKSLLFWRQKHIRRVLVSKHPLKDANNWPDSSVENWCYGDCDAALFAYQELEKLDVEHALLFGGGGVNAMFYENRLVDSLYLTLAPKIIGLATSRQFVDSVLSRPADLTLQASQVSKNHVFLTYTVKKSVF